jgi:hypothetical protein
LLRQVGPTPCLHAPPALHANPQASFLLTCEDAVHLAPRLARSGALFDVIDVSNITGARAGGRGAKDFESGFHAGMLACVVREHTWLHCRLPPCAAQSAPWRNQTRAVGALGASRRIQAANVMCLSSPCKTANQQSLAARPRTPCLVLTHAARRADKNYVGVEPVLRAFGPLLKPPASSPQATLLTTFMNWTRFLNPDKFVADGLTRQEQK